MAKIPPVIDSDTDDVAWALQTAATLADRGEIQNALVWLRRAVVAAENDPPRSLELASAAADLADALDCAIDDALDDSTDDRDVPADTNDLDDFEDISISVVCAAPSTSAIRRRLGPVPLPPPLPMHRDASPNDPNPVALPPVALPPVALPAISLPAIALPAIDLRSVDDNPPQLAPTEQVNLAEDASVEVLSGAVEPPDVSEIELLAIDPPKDANRSRSWSPLRQSVSPPPLPVIPAPAHQTAAPLAPEPEPTVPARRMLGKTRRAAPVAKPTNKGPKPAPLVFDEPLVPDSKRTAEAHSPSPLPPTPSAPVVVAKPTSSPVPEFATENLVDAATNDPTEAWAQATPNNVDQAVAEDRAQDGLDQRVEDVAALAADAPLPVVEADPPEPQSEATQESIRQGDDATLEHVQAFATEPGCVPEDAEPRIDLSFVEAFSDMPDDTRVEFERLAMLCDMHANEEVSGVALAWIERGRVAVMSLVSDTPAVILEPNEVIPSCGSIALRVPVRLVCMSEHARMAVWTEEAVGQCFGALPWVEEELRAAADRIHALVGATLGPLGEALDADIWAAMSPRLHCQWYAAGETLVAGGEIVPGLLIVGVGSLHVFDAEGTVVAVLGVGDIVFPGELVALEEAPATACAGTDGAVMLVADRSSSRELMLTYPPLFEYLLRC